LAKIRIPTPDGRGLEGEEMDFKAVTEPWCVYQLEDGYTVKLRLVVTQVIKTAQKDGDGNPVYAVRSSNVMAVTPPETYKKGDLQ
jgi:hypothetical protein